MCRKMQMNAVVKKLRQVVGRDNLWFLSGTVNGCGTTECNLVGERGSVYGFAVKLNKNEKNTVFNSIPSEHRSARLSKADEWKSVGGDYYPLYWGKDKNMGIRIYSHTKTMKQTGTIQLNTIKGLEGRDVIYGAMPCLNQGEKEGVLHEKYPDLLKTIKGKRDELKMKDVNEDE